MGKIKFISLVLLVLAASCKTTRDYYNNKGELKNITDSKLINTVENNYTKFNTLFFKKFKAEVAFNGESKSFKGNLYLQKDSSIIVSINPLMGIELFRVKLSPNKVEVIDRPKKKYSVGNYSLLWEKFLVELDYATIQKILLNELYTYPITDSKNKYIKRYKHYAQGDHYQLKSVKDARIDRKNKRDKTGELVLHEFAILPEIFKISQSYIRDFGVNSEITINYEKFSEVNGFYMPRLFDIVGKRGNEQFSMTIEFEHIEIDSENSLGFKVSSRYEKIKL